MSGTGRSALGSIADAALSRIDARLGGSARRRSVFVLAACLALNSADVGAMGALAAELERSLRIGNTEFGLLVTVSTIVGAIATVPVGALTDRVRRNRLLAGSVLLWGLAQAVSGLSVSFLMLLLSRVALGAVTATAGPTVASLTGDLFPPRERARIYGRILTGDLIGTGVGVVLAGLVGGWAGWRAAFMVLAVPSLVLAWVIARFLPEPDRGLAGREPGAGDDGRSDGAVRRLVDDEGVEPAEEIVVRTDPADMTLRQAVAYVLRVRTNVVLIVASSLGYLFFGGLRTFAVIFLRGRYGIGQGPASLLLLAVGAGAVAGVLLGGRVADRRVAAGHIAARLSVGAVGYVVTAIILVPALISTSLVVSAPLFVLAGLAVSVPNPPVDAARLDVVPARLWGRAEGVRTLLRNGGEAFAPLLFGVLSEVLGSRGAGIGAGVNTAAAATSPAQGRGLALTFLVMLVPLLLGGLLLLRGRRTYPTDVASALASDRATEAQGRRDRARPARPEGGEGRAGGSGGADGSLGSSRTKAPSR